MRNFLLTSAAVATGLVLAPTVARADTDDLTLRLDPAFAAPLSSPQTDRFNVGGELELKPTLGLKPWLDANLTLSALALPSRLTGVDTGTAFGAGVGLRALRPHDYTNNTDDGIDAVSPWLDAEGQLVGTGPLARFQFGVGAGFSVPTSADRDVWVGPFIRYTQVVDSTDTTPGFDNSDARVVLVGLEIEIGPKQSKPVSAPVEADTDGDGTPDSVDACPTVPGPKWNDGCPPPAVVAPCPKPEVVKIQEKIQFPFDQATPLPSSQQALDNVLKVLLAHPGWKVEIDGHASSEGQVAHNEKLSVQRAQAVENFLTAHGVPAGDLTVKGFGSRRPIAPNDTEAHRAKNRRVEFNVDLTLTSPTGDAK